MHTPPFIHYPAMAAQIKYRCPEVLLLLAGHLWESETRTHRPAHCARRLVPSSVSVVSIHRYLITGSGNKSHSFTSASSLGAREHEAICQSQSERALLETIKGPTMGCQMGNCIAGVALTFSLLPDKKGSAKSPGSLQAIFDLILP